QSFSDFPFPLYFKELDRAFPNSKFILTTRDLDGWLESVRTHFSRIPIFRELDWHLEASDHMHSTFYGTDQLDAAVFRKRFEEFHQEVLDYFKNRPEDLLVLDITQGHGWEPLCAFLGVAPPEHEPFPFLNPTYSNRFWENVLHEKTTPDLRKELLNMIWELSGGNGSAKAALEFHHDFRISNNPLGLTKWALSREGHLLLSDRKHRQPVMQFDPPWQRNGNTHLFINGQSKKGTVRLHQTQYRAYPRISFCIACMGRLSHIQATLKQNLDDNARYARCEFVLLDYNSPDGMEDWVQTNFSEYLEEGRLVYCRTTEPAHFQHAHARNLALQLGSGEILVNVDADNFTGPDFAFYLAEAMQHRDQFACGITAYRHGFGSFGRVAVWREQFHAVNGYDEGMSGYGYEDDDFYSRLVQHGYRPLGIPMRFLRGIKHGNDLREQYTFHSRDRSMALNRSRYLDNAAIGRVQL
ncbi:MAG: sulfotransferase, partial [Bacteroidota bacterium]